MNKLTTVVTIAVATMSVMLLATWPKNTNAQEVAEWERMGEWDENGSRFGNIVVRGELAADANVAGGWVIVRTFENKGDLAEKCTVEERLLRTETMPDARVEPAPFALIDRTQTFDLGPHQKRSIGIPLPAPIGEEIARNAQRRDAIESARARAMDGNHMNALAIADAQTYMRFHVDYVKPLPPGATAAPTENGVFHPVRMMGP